MQIVAFRHLWGLEGEDLEHSLPRIAEKGYVGVEAALQESANLDRLRQLTSDNGLTIRPIMWLAAKSVTGQIGEYRQLLELAQSVDPDGITIHSGCDAWSREDSIAFYRAAVQLEAEFGLEVGHETHRRRSLFTPWDTAAILEAEPRLRLVCDFSHWTVVTESLLEDHLAAVELAAKRAVHIHARVGYEEGPQVVDPRRPEAAAALGAHEEWWERIWAAQSAAGVSRTSFAPEYGPPPYLPAGFSPAFLEQICDWQAERTRRHFETWQATAAGS